jgi:CheY-like chemotaxis protein
MDRILVVEDEKNIRELIQETLSISDYEVEQAIHGEQAIDLAKNNRFDLVLCDVMMPIMDGMSTLEAFQKDKDLSDIPFVFLSALNEQTDIRKGMLKGAEDYLTKPFKTNELLQVVELQLKKAKRRSSQSLKGTEGKILAERSKNLEVLESYMKCAGNVQNAIIPTKEQIDACFPNNFVFFRPKYEVSGDFYWMKDQGNKKLISVIDCTGHGISASLLSMSYYTALNNKAKSTHCITPKNLFEGVIADVNEYLSEHGPIAHDTGMDGLVCEIDIEKKVIRYVGARRPLYLLSENEPALPNSEFKAKRSVGKKTLYRIKAGNRYFKVNHDKAPLKERTIPYNEGDIIYLNSDGFEDQFGGDDDKRFKSVNFMNLLESFKDEPLEKQKEILVNAFDNWKEGYQQIDDVTVIGIKLS